MAQERTCWMCNKPWVFHDDDKAPYFCTECHGVYANIRLWQDIESGKVKVTKNANGDVVVIPNDE